MPLVVCIKKINYLYFPWYIQVKENESWILYNIDRIFVFIFEEYVNMYHLEILLSVIHDENDYKSSMNTMVNLCVKETLL